MNFRLPNALDHENTEQAVSYLRNYFSRTLDPEKPHGGATYSGEYFDPLVEDPSPNQFTAEDLFAVSCLSVPIFAPTAVQLIKPGDVQVEIGILLETIPQNVALWELDSLPSDWPAFELEKQLRELPQIGMVRASKLIARKRPHLYPVLDSVVQKVTQTEGSAFTVPFWEKLREDDEALVKKLRAIHREVGLPEEISLLRVFDVVAWMEGTSGAGEDAVAVEVERGD